MTLNRVKYILPLLLILSIAAHTSAQNFQRRGFALGADRDTLLYIIASPFDNWFITIGGGAQTFMGNEIVRDARHNKLNFNARVEVGKWIIPDVAVSARLSIMNIDGQTSYIGKHPFVNPSEDVPNDTWVPVSYGSGAINYYPFHAHALSFMGFVTLDWTNFFLGYESGRRNRWHIFTPIGLGASMLFGLDRNPNNDYRDGSFRRNFELSYAAALGVEYEVSKNIAFNLQAELFGSESTWDWSPYDNAHGIFDVIPSFNVGVRLNLLKNVTKYNPYTKSSSRERVNHEFLAFGTRTTVSNLNGRIERLNTAIDSIQNLSDNRGKNDSVALAALSQERDSLQRQLDSAEVNSPLYGGRMPVNVLEELINANEHLGLPATIVYFQLDRYELDYNGRKRLQNFAREMADVDDTVEFYIIGAADSATGTPRHNQWLSERRCEAAYNMLTQHFDMDANQLITIPVGGITDYDPQENNRMAMVIMRSPEVDKIIDRWLNRRKSYR